MNDEFGDGIHLILGLKDGEAEEQSLRFDKSKFSADEAREWLADHDYEVIKFEPAVEERAMDVETDIVDEVREGLLETHLPATIIFRLPLGTSALNGMVGTMPRASGSGFTPFLV